MFNKSVILLNKPIGLTPLQAIDAFRSANTQYNDAILGYAGRLDPMAEGLLLILVNEENKKRTQYEALTKQYEFDVLFGVATDTYDVMGLITNELPVPPHIHTKLKNLIPSYVGTADQSYPPYSSAVVKGKPLYYWAREGKLDSVSIPKKQVIISSLRFITSYAIDSKMLHTAIKKRIEPVRGDFRQQAILDLWKEFFSKHPTNVFPVYTLRVSCSSGTYIRALAHEIGQKLGSCAIAYRIRRTAVGNYLLEDALTIQ